MLKVSNLPLNLIKSKNLYSFQKIDQIPSLPYFHYNQSHANNNNSNQIISNEIFLVCHNPFNINLTQKYRTPLHPNPFQLAKNVQKTENTKFFAIMCFWLYT